MPREVALRAQPVQALIQSAQGNTQLKSLAPETVKLPPLRTGAMFFRLWPVMETPHQGAWAETSFESCAPPVFLLQDALVLGATGITCTGSSVLAETLPARAAAASCLEPAAGGLPPGVRHHAGGISLTATPVATLAGTHIGLLAPGASRPDAALLHTLARLASLDDPLLMEAESLLVPAGTACLPEMLALLDLLPSLAVRDVAAHDRLAVEKLLLPLTVSGDMEFHPCLREFFGKLSGAVPAVRGVPLPRRLYLVGGETGEASPLLDDQPVIAALKKLGFTPVALAQLTLGERIALLRHAEAIVAPAGATLAHLGFCRPGALLIELLAAEDTNWRFRRLAALCGLHYDCVLGRGGQISAAHVAAAVGAHLPQTRAAA